MSNDIRIKNGLTINLKGAAKNIVKEAPYPKSVSLNPSNFHLIIPKMVVRVGEKVNVGDVIFYSKKDERIKFCSPVDGLIKEIVRGAKRKIIEIVIDVDKNQKKLEHNIIELEKLNADEIKNIILNSGCWPFIKQRPYEIIANPSEKPKSIFISSFNSAPISADFQIILDDQKEEFKTGLKVLSKLTDGEINICIKKDISTFINDIKGIKTHIVSGPHPSGNVGVQIHHINPINSGERVWTLGPEDVAILGRFFLTGFYNPIRTIAVSGAPVKYPKYYKTIIGSELREIINDVGIDLKDSLRIINGDVLTGTKVEPDNYLGFYNNTVSVLGKEINTECLVGYLLLIIRYRVFIKPLFLGYFPITNTI